MSRFAVAGLLFLSGCSALGLTSSEAPTHSVAMHHPGVTSGFVPDPILSALGDEPRGAIMAAEQQALRAPAGGESYSWAAEGVSGRVVAGPIYMVNSRTCRALVHVAERDGQRLRGSTTLCQTEGGTWEPVG